ncbi:DUF3289 family protein [Vibrio sp. PP-XX7]
MSESFNKVSGRPMFEVTGIQGDLFSGTVLTVHDIWAMKVYAENLEYKGNQIRGTFRYEIQDHFGLDTKDINHPENWNQESILKRTLRAMWIPGILYNIYDDVKFYGRLTNKFELIEGFRSWYLLQHYVEYGFKPLFTDISFNLEIHAND